MQYHFTFLIILYMATLLLALPSQLLMYFLKDKNFKKKLKVPRIPRQTNANYKKDSRFNLDVMDQSSNHFDFGEQIQKPKSNFHVKVSGESERTPETTQPPQPRKIAFESQEENPNTLSVPKIKRKIKSKSAHPADIMKIQNKNERQEQNELHWKYFFTLEKYVHQMTKFYPHFGIMFLQIHKHQTNTKRRKKCQQFCLFLKYILLYITPIFNLYFRFDASWNRALRGVVFSQRLHVTAMALFLISISLDDHTNFIVGYGLLFSLLYFPNSLWRRIFIQSFGNPNGQKISFGMVRIIPSLENSHSFKYKVTTSLILQIVIIVIYIGSSTGLIVVAGMQSNETQFQDALKAFIVATVVGILVIAPLKALVLALILTFDHKNKCVKCMRIFILDQQVLEMYNDIVLLRNLWVAEGDGDPRYHPEWKKAIMVQMTTY